MYDISPTALPALQFTRTLPRLFGGERIPPLQGEYGGEADGDNRAARLLRYAGGIFLF